MARKLPILAAIAVVVISGLVHAQWNNRAKISRELTEATARIEKAPLTVGDWKGSVTQMDRRGLDRAGIVGLAARRYENRRTAESVSILLVCGKPGPISVHGPEICYPSSGFEEISSRVKTSVGEKSSTEQDDFWMTNFRKEDAAVPQRLRIYWAWNSDGAWKASDSPRLAFASASVLYKLYIIRETTLTDERAKGDPCLDFAEVFLPELKKVLFPNP